MLDSLSLENKLNQLSSDASNLTLEDGGGVSGLLNVDVANRKYVSDFKKQCRNKSIGLSKQSVEYVGDDLKDLLSQHANIIDSPQYQEANNKFLKYTSSKEKEVARELPHVTRKILDLTNLVLSEYQSKEEEVKRTFSVNKSKETLQLLSFTSVVASFREWRDRYQSDELKNNPISRAEHIQNFFPLLKAFSRELAFAAGPSSLKNWFRGRQKDIFSRHVEYATSGLQEYLRDRIYLTYTEAHDLHEMTTSHFIAANYSLHKQFAAKYLQLKDACGAKEYHSLIASMAMLNTMRTVHEYEVDLQGRRTEQRSQAAAQTKWQRAEEEAQWAAEAARQAELADGARARRQADDAARADLRHQEAEHYLSGKDAFRAELQSAVAQHDSERAQGEISAKAEAKAKEHADNARSTQISTPNHAQSSTSAEGRSENTTFASNGTAYPVVNTVTGERAVVLKKDTVYETRDADGISASYTASEVLPIRMSYSGDRAIGAEHGPLVPGAYKSTGKRIEFPRTSGLVGSTAPLSTAVAHANRVQPYPVVEASRPYKASPGQRAQIDLTGAHAQASYRLPQHLSRAVLNAVSAPPQAFDSAFAVQRASRSIDSSISSPPGADVSTSLLKPYAASRKGTGAKVAASAVAPSSFGMSQRSQHTQGTQGDHASAPSHTTPHESPNAYQRRREPRTAGASGGGGAIMSRQAKITPDQLTEALRLAGISLRYLVKDREYGARSYAPYAQQFFQHLNTKGVHQNILAFPAEPVPPPSGSGDSSKRPPSPGEQDTSSKKLRTNPDTDPGRATSGMGRADSLEDLAQGDNIQRSAPSFFENHPERADLMAALKYAFQKIGEKKLRRANRQGLRHLWVDGSISDNRAGIKEKVLENCPDFNSKEITEQRSEHAKGVAAFYGENVDTAAYCGEISHLFVAYIRENAPALGGNFFVLSMEQSEEDDEGQVVPLDPDNDESDAHAFILYTESDEAKREIADDYNDDEDVGIDSHVEFDDFVGLILANADTSLILDPWGSKKVIDVSSIDQENDLRRVLRRIVRGAGLKYDPDANKLLLFSEDNPGNAYS